MSSALSFSVLNTEPIRAAIIFILPQNRVPDHARRRVICMLRSHREKGIFFLLGDLDGGQHLFSRLHPQIVSQPSLERRKNEIRHEQEALALTDDIADIQVLPVGSLAHRGESAVVQLDAHAVRAFLLDGSAHLIDALARDMSGSHQNDLPAIDENPDPVLFHDCLV